jgi:hypothetical protein
MTEWMDKEPTDNGHYGKFTGKTIETPGMVRWYNDSHYFLKRRTPEATRWVLGLETRFGQDGAYEFLTSIEFDNDETVDIIDRIATFNDLPTYTELMEVHDKLSALLRETERMDQSQDYYFRNKMRDILGK